MFNEEEIIKCKKDFSYFSEKYLKVIHPVKGLTTFNPYEYQKRLVDIFENNRFVIGKKFRQGGFSTTSALYALWKCMLCPDQNFLFVSKTDRCARFLNGIVKIAIENLPEELKPELSKNNDHEKFFPETNSSITFLSPIARIAKAATHLIIEEAAFIKNFENHWKAMYPVISTGGKCFILSTVNITNNWFSDTYYDAIQGKNKFSIFYSYFRDHPDYNNDNWIAKVKENLGEKIFTQEFECQFLDKQECKSKRDKLLLEITKIINNHSIDDVNIVGEIISELEKYQVTA